MSGSEAVFSLNEDPNSWLWPLLGKLRSQTPRDFSNQLDSVFDKLFTALADCSDDQKSKTARKIFGVLSSANYGRGKSFAHEFDRIVAKQLSSNSCEACFRLVISFVPF